MSRTSEPPMAAPQVGRSKNSFVGYADQDRTDQTARVASGQQYFRDGPGQQAQNDPADDAHRTLLFSGAGAPAPGRTRGRAGKVPCLRN